jgi:long-chain acyl-CoA synthetase
VPTEATTVSLAEMVSAAADRRPESVALSLGRRELTYTELDRASAALCADIAARGIEAGDPVAVVAGTGLEFPVATYGLLRLGAVVVPISPASPEEEVTQLLRAARAEMVITDMDHEELAWAAARKFDRYCGAVTLDGEATRSAGDMLALKTLASSKTPDPAPRLKPGAPAAILFTSGSTGRAKGVVHSHDSLYRNAYSVAYDMVGLTRKDVMLGVLPLAHSFGLSAVLNACMLAGARLELMARFDVDAAWKLIRERGITVLTGAPTMYRRLAHSRKATPHTDLRLAVVSGSSCPAQVARDVRQWMAIPIIERYGMTEASPLTWRLIDETPLEGDVGRPAWGVHIRAVNSSGIVLPAGKVGELEVQAPSMMSGYLTARDNRSAFRGGWFRTGDLGAARVDGGITLSGRLKDVILRAGYSVAAREVEMALEAHPTISEAAVIGVPDDDLGEEVAAVVVPARGREAHPEELDQYLLQKLARWKRPRLWHVTDELPRTSLGKIRKDELLGFFLTDGRR